MTWESITDLFHYIGYYLKKRKNVVTLLFEHCIFGNSRYLQKLA